ncbi:nonstructural protein 2 [Galliform chaphamaparvovirus 13]|nr:nonstructural protein 2 [Galliform chaphamaparvovirus 13]
MLLMSLELVNLAANAVIAKQAAAARLALASQSLAQCREQTNPYLPGNSGPFGPTRAQLYGPDPCLEQEKELAAATTAHQDAVALAQRSAAPTPQDLQSAPAPQLSSTWDVNDTDPGIPISEFLVPVPMLNNSWSPDSLDDVLAAIAMELEEIAPGSTSDSEVEEQMEIIRENMVSFLLWSPWDRKPRKRKPFQYRPNNKDWIGRWVPE